MSSDSIWTLISNKKQGFLLIEVLIALSLLCLAVLGVGGYYQHLYSNHAEGKNRLRALSIARSSMERLCAGNQHLIDPAVEQFKISWNITPHSSDSYAKLRIEVSWEHRPGAIRMVTLDSGVVHEHV